MTDSSEMASGKTCIPFQSRFGVALHMRGNPCGGALPVNEGLTPIRGRPGMVAREGDLQDAR